MGYLSNSNGSSAPLCSQEALQAPLQKAQSHGINTEQLQAHNFSKAIETAQLDKFSKPSEETRLSEIERETVHVNQNYGIEIDEY